MQYAYDYLIVDLNGIFIFFLLSCIFLIHESEKELTWISIRSMQFLKIVVAKENM